MSTTPVLIPQEHPGDLLEIDRYRSIPWGRREVRLASIAMGAHLFLAVLALGTRLWWLSLTAVFTVGAAFFVYAFFRNPRRTPPRGPGLVVSPADGKVTDIETVDEPHFIGGPAVRIGIFLSIFSVHVNRAPARGRVEWLEHKEGAFHDARKAAAQRENECNWIGIVRDDLGGPDGVRLAVRQISGAIARRIICPLEQGARVARGGLIGMIKFGSRTELYLPAGSGAEVRVRVGDKVKGGESVLAAWNGAAAGVAEPAAGA